jgi:hypothetical protein
MTRRNFAVRHYVGLLFSVLSFLAILLIWSRSRIEQAIVNEAEYRNDIIAIHIGVLAVPVAVAAAIALSRTTFSAVLGMLTPPWIPAALIVTAFAGA